MAWRDLVLRFTPNCCYGAMIRCLNIENGESRRPLLSSISPAGSDSEVAAPPSSSWWQLWKTPTEADFLLPNDPPAKFADYPYNLPTHLSYIKDATLRKAARTVLYLRYSRILPSFLLALATAASYEVVGAEANVSELATTFTVVVNFIFYTALYPEWVGSVIDTFKMLPLLLKSQRHDLRLQSYSCLRALGRLSFFALHAVVYITLFTIAATNALPILLSLLRVKETGNLECPLQPGTFSVTENGLSPCWVNQVASLILVFAEGVTAAPEIIHMTWIRFLMWMNRRLNTKTTENRQFIVGQEALLARLQAQEAALAAIIDNHDDSVLVSALQGPVRDWTENDGLEVLMLLAAQAPFITNSTAVIDTSIGKYFYNLFGYTGSLLMNLSFLSAGFIGLTQAVPELMKDLLGENPFSTGLSALLQAPLIVQVALMVVAVSPDIFLLGRLSSKFFPNLIQSVQHTLTKSSLKRARDFLLLAGIMVACLFSTVGMTTGTNESIEVSLMDTRNSTIVHNTYLDTMTRALFAHQISGESLLSQNLWLGTLITIVVTTFLNACTVLMLKNGWETADKRSQQRVPLLERPQARTQANVRLTQQLLSDLYRDLIRIMQSPFFKIRSIEELNLPLLTSDEIAHIRAQTDNSYQQQTDPALEAYRAHSNAVNDTLENLVSRFRNHFNTRQLPVPHEQKAQLQVLQHVATAFRDQHTNHHNRVRELSDDGRILDADV